MNRKRMHHHLIKLQSLLAIFGANVVKKDFTIFVSDLLAF